MDAPRLVDLAALTDAEVAEIYALPVRVRTAAAPDEPRPSMAEIIVRMRNLPKSRTSMEWVVEGGYVELGWDDDNPDASVSVNVAPEARRRGIGTMLLEFAAEKARAAGRTSLRSNFADATGAGFAAALGARIGNTGRVSVLELPVRDLARPVPVPGYTVRSWRGAAPEELLVSWACAMNAVNDAPHTEGQSPWTCTPESVRDQERAAAAAGSEVRVTVALSGDGEAVASTEMRVGMGERPIAQTHDTSVVAAHRRRGLARWIKLESLGLLMAERPDAVMVNTYNDATNVGMLAVNYSVGFKTVAEYTQAVIEL